MEKEQSYKDAATNYELAWKYSHQASPAIGKTTGQGARGLVPKSHIPAVDRARGLLSYQGILPTSGQVSNWLSTI